MFKAEINRRWLVWPRGTHHLAWKLPYKPLCGWATPAMPGHLGSCPQHEIKRIILPHLGPGSCIWGSKDQELSVLKICHPSFVKPLLLRPDKLIMGADPLPGGCARGRAPHVSPPPSPLKEAASESPLICMGRFNFHPLNMTNCRDFLQLMLLTAPNKLH